MDDISREPLPDHPGQRVDSSGVRCKEPAEWAGVDESHDIDGLDRLGSKRFLEPIDAGQMVDERNDALDMGGGFDREDPLMDLDAVPGEEEIPEDADRAGEDSQADSPGESASEAPQDEADIPADQDSGDEVPVEDTPAAAVAAAELAESEDGDQDEQLTEAPPEDQLSRVIGALLLSSRESLTLLRLAQATNTTTKQVRVALASLSESLESAGLALVVSINGDQVRLMTTPDVFDYLRNLRSVKKQEKLSAAALETLAVVAYRQPVMRAEIEAIRGVKAGPILRTLLDHRMVKMVGRADVPGRPLQYGTTQHFLETFGLESLSDLPSVKEFRQL